MHLLFSPIQLEAYGGNYVQGEGFSYRYQISRRLGGLWKSIFIPLGPNILNEEGIEEFIKDLSKFNKVAIELPLILDKTVVKKVRNSLEKAGFKKEDYLIHEDETLITTQDLYELDKDTRYEVRYGQKRADFEVKYDPKSEYVENAYIVYTEAAARIGYTPKSRGAFNALSRSSLVSLAMNDDEPVGFVLGYIVEAPIKGLIKKSKGKVLHIVLAGTTKKGRELNVGANLYDSLIRLAFNRYEVDVIDMFGASRKRNPSYLTFKKKFAQKFVSLPGRYVRTKLI